MVSSNKVLHANHVPAVTKTSVTDESQEVCQKKGRKYRTLDAQAGIKGAAKWIFATWLNVNVSQQVVV